MCAHWCVCVCVFAAARLLAYESLSYLGARSSVFLRLSSHHVEMARNRRPSRGALLPLRARGGLLEMWLPFRGRLSVCYQAEYAN